MLRLHNGQRLETAADRNRMKVSEFEEYVTLVGTASRVGAGSQGTKSQSTWSLLQEPTNANLGELGWRVGMALTAFNFVLIAVAVTTGNPRAGRGGNLFFTLFSFVFYYNLLNLGQSWISSGLVGALPFMLALHGGVFALALLWLTKRHLNIGLRDGARAWLRRHRPDLVAGGAA